MYYYRRVLSVVMLGMAFAWGGVPTAAAATISATGSFTRYTGDVTPTTQPFETFINGVQVPLDNPAHESVNHILQGTLALPAGTTSVEFKNQQPGLPFNEPSSISFQGVSQELSPRNPDAPFKIGTISVKNGIFFFEANFDITIATQSSDPFFDNRSFSDTLRYVVTPNTGDPVLNAAANADYVYFVNHKILGEIRVYETASGLGDSGSVDLYGKVGSLDPLFFANPTGGVFIQSAPDSTATLPLLGLGVVLLAVGRSGVARAKYQGVAALALRL